MSKKVLSFLLALLMMFVLPACSGKTVGPVSTPRPMAGENSSTAKVLQRPDLQESKIMFLDIQWGMPEDIAIELVKERFPDINSSEEESYPEKLMGENYRESENFSDPESRVFPFYSSRTVETKLVKLKHNVCSGQYSYTSSLGSVAGYSVNAIYLYFVYQDSQYRLYKAAYYFEDSDDMEPLGQFTDLQSKMTNLYGKPETTYTYDNSEGSMDATHACAVWDGGDSSAAYLKYTIWLSGYLNGSESVWLYYGTTSVNDYFVNTEEARLAREEAEQKEKIDAIKADDSGL